MRRYCRLNGFNLETAKKEYSKLDQNHRSKLMAEMRLWLKVEDKNYGKANVPAKSRPQTKTGK